MKHKIFSLVSLLILVMLFAACAPQGSATEAPDSASGDGADSTPSNGSVGDLDSLIDALVAGGTQVAMGEPIEQEFFSVTGQILKVNGADVQVFEYESAEAMEVDAAPVAPDGGSIGTSMVMWVESPHFFKSGNLLVLYVGEDAAVLDLLRGALGEQFAGR